MHDHSNQKFTRLNNLEEFNRYDDEDIGHDIVHQLKNITDKGKCYDIFQSTSVDKVRMYQRRTVQDVIFYSINLKKIKTKLKRI